MDAGKDQTTSLDPGRDGNAPRLLGTFLGVFTPSVLAMLSGIMYLRFGWVVSQVGAGGALLILLIGWLIALSTALSASALASNMKVGVGGEYYLFSRTLGLTLGGTVGIPLLLCRILSVTLHSVALAEAIGFLWPDAFGAPPLRGIAIVIVLFSTAVSAKSISLALKLQIPMMVAIGLSVLALAWGVFSGPLARPSLMMTTSAGSAGFWYVFAVFFPAVTGVVAGVGLSGDLKDPQRSIPRGILSAVFVTAAIYLVVLVLLSITGRVGFAELADISPDKPSVWTKITFLGGLFVLPGLWGAALSSVFGGILSAPRVMQALARDGILPRPLRTLSADGQPRVATWICGALAIGAVFIGDLNDVAKIVTIFFMTFWGMMNLTAALEALAGAPSYRPTIRVPWYVSLSGGLGCLFVMFLVSHQFCLVALIFETAVWLLLRRKALCASWGNVWTGVWGALARMALVKMGQSTNDSRNWRPHILLFADDIRRRGSLVQLASSLNQDCGILTVCELFIGRPDDRPAAIVEHEAGMAAFFGENQLVAFGEVDVVEEFESGAMSVTQANGMGSLRSNTIMFGWTEGDDRLEALLRMATVFHNIGKSTIIAKPPAKRKGTFDRIDIWWRGREGNGDLLLLLGHLLSLSPQWSGAQLTVRCMVQDEMAKGNREEEIRDLLRSARINARYAVQIRDAGIPLHKAISAASRGADVVFLGIPVLERGGEIEAARKLRELVADIPAFVLIRNARMQDVPLFY